MIDQLIRTIGTILILMAISIVSMYYLWHIIKPTIEAKELQYLRDNNLTGG